jgi:uncharacterized integral membrane protein
VTAAEPDRSDPPWPREAFGALVHEIGGWLRALLAVARAPRRFAADWADGRIRPLNPLAYALNGLALSGPVTAIIVWLVGIGVDELPFWAQVLKPLFPWVYNLVLVLPMHAGLRLLGSQRRLRTTIGAFFYGAGPLHILRLFFLPLQLLQMIPSHQRDWRVIVAGSVAGLLQMVLFAIYLVACQAGAHKLKAWRAALPTVIVFLASVVGWGWFGIHFGPSGLRIVRAMIT